MSINDFRTVLVMLPIDTVMNVTVTSLMPETSNVKLNMVPLPDGHSLVSLIPFPELISRPVSRYDATASSAL